MVSVNVANTLSLLNDVYKPLLKDHSRYLVLYGGAGSGKSNFTAQKIILRMILQSNHKFLVVRKTEKSIRESARADLIDVIVSMGLDSLFTYSNSPTGEMTIVCPNNNKIIFRGIDQREKIKSIKGITSGWVEESSELSLDDFTQLDLRIRGSDLENYVQWILSFNPISSMHWLKTRFFDNKDELAKILHTTYKDNRYLDDNYIKILNALKQTNLSYYNIYALGKWGVLKGQIYTKYTEIDSMPKDAEIHRWGLDFGFNHPMALTEVMIDGNNLYINEIFYKSNYTTSEMIREVKQTHPHIQKLRGRADSAEPDRIKELNSSGFMTTKAIKIVISGIDKVKSYNLHVTKRSQNIINELGLYAWKLDSDDNPLDEPIKLNDDAMDSIRYAVFTEPTAKANSFQVQI